MAKKALVLGSFDLTHAGHFHLFESASKLADEVHVGIAHDSLVRAFKGDDRPIYSVGERRYMIRMCKYVTHVYIYGDPSSTKDMNDHEQQLIVLKVKPDIFVQGVDKQDAPDLPGWLEDQGIQRVSTPRLSPEITTSHFIRKIREVEPKGFEAFAKARGDVSQYYYPQGSTAERAKYEGR